MSTEQTTATTEQPLNNDMPAEQTNPINQDAVEGLYGKEETESKDSNPSNLLGKDSESNDEEQVASEQDESGADESSKDESESEEGGEAIEYELKLSEESPLEAVSEKMISEVMEFAKEHKLSNEVAQHILNDRENIIHSALEMGQMQEDAQIEEWKQSVIDDPHLGGQNLNETVAKARKAVEVFGGEEIATLLQETGYGNHPAIVRLFSKLGELTNDDVLLSGSGYTPAPKSTEDIFYGN